MCEACPPNHQARSGKPKRSTEAAEARRAERRQGLGPDGAERTAIAQAAARIIAEHGLPDWAAAKRKAAREMGLPDRAALPGDDEVEDALAEYHELFGGDEHVAMIRERRTEALQWLRRFASLDARLVGGVAAGWATEHSDIRIELATDDAKSVEFALLNDGIEYRALPGDRDEAGEYYIDTRARRRPAVGALDRRHAHASAAQPARPRRTQARCRGGGAAAVGAGVVTARTR